MTFSAKRLRFRGSKEACFKVSFVWATSSSSSSLRAWRRSFLWVTNAGCRSADYDVAAECYDSYPVNQNKMAHQRRKKVDLEYATVLALMEQGMSEDAARSNASVMVLAHPQRRTFQLSTAIFCSRFYLQDVTDHEELIKKYRLHKLNVWWETTREWSML